VAAVVSAARNDTMGSVRDSRSFTGTSERGCRASDFLPRCHPITVPRQTAWAIRPIGTAIDATRLRSKNLTNVKASSLATIYVFSH
jgi:hypothetical protein